MQLSIRNRSVVFRDGINRKPYWVHDDTKKARKASSRAVDALNDIAIDYLATLSLKSAIILSHSGT